MCRILVLSGGGSKGSFAGGIIEYLTKKEKLEWDIVIGTSTGSLLAPLTVLGKINKLKLYYTNVNNGDIFNVRPLNSKGKLRFFNAIWRVLRHKNSLGVANNLKKKIREILTEDEYRQLQQSGKESLSVVTNMTTFETELKSSNVESYEEYCDWMLCSSSVPILFEVQEKNGDQYLDGGILNTVPIQDAINMGATEIDVIILSAEVDNDYSKMKNIFDVAMRTIDFMNKEINNDDINIGKLYGEQKEVKINIYRTPTSLTKNAINFNKEEMVKWWDMGYAFAKSKFNKKSIVLKRTIASSTYKMKK